jgi:hypothetical protein
MMLSYLRFWEIGGLHRHDRESIYLRCLMYGEDWIHQVAIMIEENWGRLAEVESNPVLFKAS